MKYLVYVVIVVLVLGYMYLQSRKRKRNETAEANSPPQSVDPDSVRKRRLERFGTTNIAPTSPVSTENVDDPNVIQTNSSRNLVRRPVATNGNGSAKKESEKREKNSDFLNILEKQTKERTPPSTPESVHIKPVVEETPKKVIPAIFKTPEYQLHRILCKIFKVTVNESEVSEGFTLLESLSKELRATTPIAESNILIIKDSDIDTLLIERISPMSNLESLQYLVQSFGFAADELRRNKDSKDVMDHCMRSIVSQVGLAAQNTPLDLLGILETATPKLFLEHLCLQWSEDLPSIFIPIYSEIFKNVQKSTLMDSLTLVKLYKIMAKLTSQPLIAKLLVTGFPNWIVQTTSGRDFQRNSFLGPFFHFTTVFEYPAFSDQYFPTNQFTVQKVDESNASLRMQIKMLQELLHEIITNLLHADGKDENKVVRDALLQWFASALNSNQARSKMHYNLIQTSTDGFLINLSSELLKLSVPFTSQPEKMNIIEVGYCLANPRSLNFSNETRFGMTTDDINNYIKSNKIEEKKQFKFITEMYFLTHYSLHIGATSIIHRYDDFLREYSQLQQRKKELNQTRNSWSQTPRAMFIEGYLKKLDDEINRMTQFKLSMDAHMFESGFVKNSMEFYGFSGLFLQKLADPEGKGLPLSPKVPPEFALLPEYFVQDVAEYLLFVIKMEPKAVDFSILSLVNFFITFMGSVDYVKNPYVRAKLSEVLFELFPHEESNNPQLTRFSYIFESNALAKKHLIPALFMLYVDIENTGRGGQFYEKFFVRRNIAVLLRYLRGIPDYHEAIKNMTKDGQLFIKFINMVMNDNTYLLDEVLQKLPEIKDIESLRENREAWAALDDNQRQDKEQALQTDTRTVKTYMKLANEIIILFHFLSEHAIEPFLAPEILERVAQMLNYFIQQLAGTKSLNLKVQNPERFDFNPKFLLQKIVEIYVVFGEQKLFVESVVRDIRSFKPEVFKRVVSILTRDHLLPDAKIKMFDGFISRAESTTFEGDDDDLDIDEDDIPSEYLDPIMSYLMKDPVKLPTSGNIVDRSTIARILLTDGKDPFNRAPLTMEMVVPETKLKEQIEEFKESKRKLKRKQDQ